MTRKDNVIYEMEGIISFMNIMNFIFTIYFYQMFDVHLWLKCRQFIKLIKE